MRDEELLAAYRQKRDPDIFAEIVGRYAGLTYGTALRITGNAHDAEEVTQECFMKLAREKGSLPRSIPAWLHRVAVNEALNLIRGRERRVRHEQAAAARNGAAATEEPKWEEIAPLLDAAINELPDESREALMLHYFREMSQPEIAEQLGVNSSTVSRRVSAAIEELRRELKISGVIMSVTAIGALMKSASVSTVTPAMKANILGFAAEGIKGGFIMSIRAKVAIGIVAAAVVVAGAAVVKNTGNYEPTPLPSDIPVQTYVTAEAPAAAAPIANPTEAKEANGTPATDALDTPEKVSRVLIEALAKGDLESAEKLFLLKEEAVKMAGEKTGEAYGRRISSELQPALKELSEKLRGAQYVDLRLGGEPMLLSPDKPYKGKMQILVPVQLLDNVQVRVRVGDKVGYLKLDEMVMIDGSGIWRLAEKPKLLDLSPLSQ